MQQLQGDAHELVETCMGSETVYRGKSYQLSLDELILPNGEHARREHVHHPGGVAILALDNDSRCALVQQYRHPIGIVTTEIPAGKLDKLPNETPEHAARRELREETGYVADSMISLGKVYPSPGLLDEVLHLFLARGLTSAQQELDDDEFIHVLWLPVGELERRIADETMDDVKAICALTRARLRGLI